MRKSTGGPKPQDILILAKLLCRPNLLQKDLATQLNISPGEVSHAVQRLKTCQLLDHDNNVYLYEAHGFFNHAVKFICPPEFGSLSYGMPTAHSFKNFSFVNEDVQLPIIWEDSSSSLEGQSLKPIYFSVPFACKEDKKLYRFLSLVEMVRSGKAREKNIAQELIKKFILEGKEE